MKKNDEYDDKARVQCDCLMRTFLFKPYVTRAEETAPILFRLPPFWLLWLTAFLVFLPLVGILPVIVTVLTGRQESLTLRDVQDWLIYSLGLTALPYLQQAFDREKLRRQWEQGQAQLAWWGQPTRRYRLLGRVASLGGGLLSLAHFATGWITGAQVALICLGLPLYYVLVVPLLAFLCRGVVRPCQIRSVAAGTSSSVAVPGVSPVTSATASVPAYGATEVAETVSVRRRRRSG